MAETDTPRTLTRDTTFDIMKGIGILLVLLGHVYEWKTVGRFVYSFHMPMFFIVAGCFAKTGDEVPDRRKAVGRYARRLLLPFLLVAVLNMGWMLGLSIVKHDWSYAIRMGLSYLYADTTYWPTPWGHLYLGITWFLLALFWAKVVFLYLGRWPRWRLWLSIALAVAALLVHRWCVYTPWCLCLGLAVLPFVAIGYEWRHRQLPAWLLWLLAACWVAAWRFSSLDIYGYDWGIYPLTLLGACGGTWLFYQLCRLCAVHLPALGRVLAWIGVCSLAIMCMHDLESTIHLGNHLRVALGLQFSTIGMYAWRYAITIAMGVACMYLPVVKKLFR